MKTNKTYCSLANHLGNVLAVISDKKVAIPNTGNTLIDYFDAEVTSISDYYPFGMQIQNRSYTATSYRFGFQGQEVDNEIKGEGNSVNFKYRMHDPRIGRFFAVDPLAPKYPHNSPYAFSENRVVDGRELEGLEYVSVHHYLTGAPTVTLFYKMPDKEIERLGGTTAGLHNSVSFGSGGKGIVHYFYDELGIRIDTYWEQRQTNFLTNMEFHGLYSGGGCVTHDGKDKSTNYNFSMQPIDWADAIAKRHDKDYAAAAPTDYVNYLDDVRTLQADYDMVSRIDNSIAKNLFKIPGMELEGPGDVETPVRTTYSSELEGSLDGQRLMISSLATYKQWKVDKGKKSTDLYKANREAFGKAHPLVALFLDTLPEANE